ncbi:hypothetical protein OSB04_026746 [Centaurea solstitialis]|uniref:Uncharacterized protein n=1 Tax=Centaurea solstitialis TaxID=347529 RepID=A0AA38SCG0_9ASTR|nr:hypothetical protein OSB04_026746 [Centaurea solstitialis]
MELLMFNVLDKGNSTKEKMLLEAVVGSVLWFIWKARNNLVFNNKRFSTAIIKDSLQQCLLGEDNGITAAPVLRFFLLLKKN